MPTEPGFSTKTPLGSSPAFEQLVFAGGGTRCFWQGGFLEVVRPPLAFEPRWVSGVSGRALAAACYLAQRGHRLLQVMCDAFAKVDCNITWRDLVRGRGITPQQRVYREVVAEVLDVEAAARIANGPSFQLLIAFHVHGKASRLVGLRSVLL